MNLSIQNVQWFRNCHFSEARAKIYSNPNIILIHAYFMPKHFAENSFQESDRILKPYSSGKNREKSKKTSAIYAV